MEVNQEVDTKVANVVKELVVRSFGYLWGKIQMTKDISYVKYVERYSLQLQTCASISSPPWGETINWPQLVLIVAPVSIGKTQDGAHWWSNKKVFQVCLDVVSTFQYEHIVHIFFSLVLGFSPLWKSL